MIKNIKYASFWSGEDSPHYFHPSICEYEDANLLLTMQTFEGVADTYGPVMYSDSKDGGNSWSEPAIIPSLQHRKHGDLTEATADIRTLFHAASRSVIAIGCNTFYGQKGNWIYDDNLKDRELRQFPIYTVRYADGSWSERKELKVDLFQNCVNWRVACAQMLVLSNLDVLLPIYFSENTSNTAAKVCSAICAFDGKELKVKAVSNILSSDSGQALTEPSLAFLNSKYYMTIRALDGHGYFSISNDALNWGKIIPWRWDSGEALTMSNTQQHWISNGKELFLVYTRKNCLNDGAFRWRAPLYMAHFDTEKLCLIRDSEVEILPLVKTANGVVNQMGNFHAIETLSGNSLISVGSLFRERKFYSKQDKFFSDTLLVEIQWNK